MHKLRMGIIRFMKLISNYSTTVAKSTCESVVIRVPSLLSLGLLLLLPGENNNRVRICKVHFYRFCYVLAILVLHQLTILRFKIFSFFAVSSSPESVLSSEVRSTISSSSAAGEHGLASL